MASPSPKGEGRGEGKRDLPTIQGASFLATIHENGCFLLHLMAAAAHCFSNVTDATAARIASHVYWLKRQCHSRRHKAGGGSARPFTRARCGLSRVAR